MVDRRCLAGRDPARCCLSQVRQHHTLIDMEPNSSERDGAADRFGGAERAEQIAGTITNPDRQAWGAGQTGRGAGRHGPQPRAAGVGSLCGVAGGRRSC